MSDFVYNPKSFQGFWYLRNGKVIQLPPEMEHIEYFLRNYESFGVSFQEIKDVLDKYGIPDIKQELKEFYQMGRKEVDLLMLALNKGNIRIRIYDTFDDSYISIEYSRDSNRKYVCNCLIDMEEKYFSKIHLPYYFYDYWTDASMEARNIDQAIVNFAD